MASTAVSIVPYAVITTTSASGATVSSALIRSIPDMPGIIRSVRTTWTRCWRQTSSALRPSSAVSTRKPSRWKIFSREARLDDSSSTTRTVVSGDELSTRFDKVSDSVPLSSGSGHGRTLELPAAFISRGSSATSGPMILALLTMVAGCGDEATTGLDAGDADAGRDAAGPVDAADVDAGPPPGCPPALGTPAPWTPSAVMLPMDDVLRMNDVQ